MTEPLIVLGAGGHAKVVISTIRACGHRAEFVLDDDPGRWNTSVLGVPVIGALALAEDMPGRAAVIAVGDNRARARIRMAWKLMWTSLVHPRAYVHESARIGAGTVIFAGAIVQPDSVIGEHCIVNTCASVDHDCILDDLVHVCPGAHLGGEVRVDEGAFVGLGARVKPRVRLRKWSVLGAGAVAIDDVGPNEVALGIPAKARTAPRGTKQVSEAIEESRVLSWHLG